MKMTRSRIIAAALGVAGVAVTVYASCTSPFPPYLTHTNNSTCNAEPCERACRLCCTAFDQPWTPAWVTCNGTCASVGGLCGDEEG